MTGYSPFQGETHQETFLNVTMCDYDFDDEMFDVVSQEAKDFIEKLLIMAPRYVKERERERERKRVRESERERVCTYICMFHNIMCVCVCVCV